MATAILTSGWIQGPGYVLFDELLLVVLIVGAISTPGVCALALPRWQSKRFFSAKFIWPAALLFYLVMHGLYGAISFDDWRLIRWPVLYVALLVAWGLFELRSRDDNKDISVSFLARVATVYFGAYLLHWVILEVVLDLRWEVFQAVSWSGSSYAMFPVVVALPLVLTLLKSDELSAHYLAYLLLSLISLCAQLYSSRAAFIVLLFLGAISLIHLPWRRAAKVALLVLITQCGALFLTNYLHLAPDYGSIGRGIRMAYSRTQVGLIEHGVMVVESVSMPFAQRASDDDRHAHMVSAMNTLYQADLTKLLLDYGQDRHKVVLTRSPGLRPFIKQGQATTRSTAFTAFVVNHGLIGIVLFTFVVVVSIGKLLRNSSLPWITTLPFYVMALAWSLLTDYRDNVLVYLVLVFNIFAMISTTEANHLSKRNEWGLREDSPA